MSSDQIETKWKVPRERTHAQVWGMEGEAGKVPEQHRPSMPADPTGTREPPGAVVLEREETQPRFQAQQDAWPSGEALGRRELGLAKERSLGSQCSGALARPAPSPTHLDDTVSLTDPAIFGCNAIGVHLQSTCIMGTWHPSLRFPFSSKGQPHLGGSQSKL